jgi:hypothetical protein
MLNFNLLDRIMIALVFGAGVLIACTNQKTLAAPSTPSAEPTHSAVPIPLPGSDRDAHGCIPSAGYSWCAKENSCVRSWELAAKKSFANTAEAYEAYCSGNSK